MVIPWGAIGSAVGSWFGSVSSSAATGALNQISNNIASAKSYKYNKQLIDYQQQWQEKMSGTAHQREVQDLTKAGLNPILSATGGSGASYGSASAPSVSVDGAQFDNPVTNALQIRQQRNQNKLTESQNKLTEEQTEKTKSDISVNDSIKDNYVFQNHKVIADIDSIYNNIENQTAMNAKQLDVLDEQMKQIRAQTKNIEENTKYVKYNAETGRIGANAGMVGAQASSVSAGASVTQSSTAKQTYNMNKALNDINIDRERRYAKWGTKHPVLRDIDESIRRYISPVGMSVPLRKH